MKHIIITTIVAVLLVGTAFADPIHDAAKNGNLAGVQAQLDAGADVNAKDKNEWTPLHNAATQGHKEIVELLLAKGADVNAKHKYGLTPLHRAAFYGHKEVVQMLIAAGADVNAKDDNGDTPLDVAVNVQRFHPNNTEIADLLRKHGGKTKKELNVLFDSIRTGNIEAVKKTHCCWYGCECEGYCWIDSFV